MNFTRKVGVAINLNDPVPDILSCLKTMDFLNGSEVHFVTVYLTTTYAIGLGETSIIYPFESDRKQIREVAQKKLREVSREVLPKHFKGQVIEECLFSDDPKRKFCDYISENHLDTVIVASREKRGIFESSFAQFITKHSQANIIILKHKI
jgi:hypothetical protein